MQSAEEIEKNVAMLMGKLESTDLAEDEKGDLTAYFMTCTADVLFNVCMIIKFCPPSRLTKTFRKYLANRESGKYHYTANHYIQCLP